MLIQQHQNPFVRPERGHLYDTIPLAVEMRRHTDFTLLIAQRDADGLVREIQHDKPPSIALCSDIGQQIAPQIKGFVVTDGESRLLASKPNELPVQAQERAGVLALRRNIDVPEIISDGQPGLSIGEPRTWGVIPLHGRALRIAAEPASEILGLRVLDPVLRNLDVM